MVRNTFIEEFISTVLENFCERQGPGLSLLKKVAIVRKVHYWYKLVWVGGLPWWRQNFLGIRKISLLWKLGISPTQKMHQIGQWFRTPQMSGDRGRACCRSPHCRVSNSFLQCLTGFLGKSLTLRLRYLLSKSVNLLILPEDLCLLSRSCWLSNDHGASGHRAIG